MLRRLPWALGALLVVTAGCQDLEVTNPNNPDRERATATPGDVQTIIASTYTKWFEDFNQNIRTVQIAAMANEFSSNFLDYGQYDTSREPREAYINQTSYTYASAAANPWIELYAVISSANDGLQAIDRGVAVEVRACGAATITDQTERARAFAKFMQALAHGYVALSYDQGFVVDEHRVLEENPPQLQPYTAVRDSAIVFMNQAIDIADAADFTLCAQDNFFPGLNITSEQLAQLGHSYIARFLAYNARTPAERADADWDQILAELDAAFPTDFAPIGSPDVFESGFKQLAARQRSPDPAPSSDHTRVDNWILGPADTSGAFQTWLTKDWTSTNTATGPVAFRILTPDRRIGNSAPPPAGAYFGYHPTLLGQAARGLYLRSHYALYRLGRGESYRQGPLLLLNDTEQHLLRAEALIRLGRADEAVPLVNLTRQANGNLPAVTIDGPPDANSCVPQKFNGTCGSLWDALRYEKRIEMVGVDAWAAWYDQRGWGNLPQGALLHFPVPARELEILELPMYTTGGPNPGSAGPWSAEVCPGPVDLPRCP